MTPTMTLKADNLAFAYRTPAWVFEDLSAAFESGQITAVLGPNGSGKSTLLRCLLGLLRPQRGAVTLGGRPVHGMAEPARARAMAYVPQRPSATTGFSVLDVVALGCGPAAAHKAARNAARSALEQFDLADRADEPFNELSHGQQQRAVLARAVTQLASAQDSRTDSPQALLADEPTSAMDPRHAVEAMDHLRDQAAAGAVVVVVLHDLTAALRSADRVLLLDASGRVAATGTPRDALDGETLRRVYGIDFTRVGGPTTGETALLPATTAPGR